jgi:hypothetical protein
MKKRLLYFLVIILYILTPICFLASAGTMVSLKYEVDEAHTFVDMKRELTDTEKMQRHTKIDEREKSLNLLLIFWASGLVLFPLTATGLLIFKKRLLVEPSSS